MNKNAFKTENAFKTDDTGDEYVEMTYNEATKNHPGVNRRVTLITSQNPECTL